MSEIISPVIANMTLDGLEKQLREAFPPHTKRGGQTCSPKVNFIRFADDFVITGTSQEQLEHEVKPLVEQFMKVTFNHVDQAIYQTVKQWMKRRHTRKSDAWIAKKYFTSLGGNNWVFHGQVNEQSCQAF